MFGTLMFGTLMCGGLGCRSLRSNRMTMNLSKARSASLRGAGLLQQEDFDEAGVLFSEALSHSSVDERAHWGLAEVLWKQDDKQRAIKHMLRAAELSGKNPDLLVRLGEMHLSTGNLAEAYEQAEVALAFNRKCAPAWALRGQVLWRQKQLDDALDSYQRALLHNPKDSASRIALAGIYHELGRPQRALATIDMLADSQPTETIPAKAWMLKGQALADLGETADSRDCLRQAQACVDDSESETLLQLAQLRFASGDRAEARLCLGRALRNNPNDPAALNFKNVVDRSFSEPGRRIPGAITGHVSPIPND